MRVRRWTTYLSGSTAAAAIALAAFTTHVGPAQAASSASPFVVTRNGNTYTATSAAGTVLTGSLKTIVQTAAATLSSGGGGTVHFTAGLFELGDSHFELKDLTNVTFEGEGMDVTRITNFRSTSTDTEVFDGTRITGGGVRDMTVNAGGPFRSTSDALDFDSGNNMVVERVKVTGARGRGIVFDGKDITNGVVRKSENNVIRGCIVVNVPSDGIELLAASNNRVEGCRITTSGGHGIQLAKSSTSADQPNKKSSGNVVVNNIVELSAQDGINVTSGDRNQITGNTLLNNSKASSARDGIKLASSDSQTCDDNVISGNTATDNQATKTQRYGLAISSSNCNRTSVSGNEFRGNRLGEILNQGTGTVFGLPAADTEAPTIPTGLTATVVGPNQINLSWTESRDNVSVAGYTIYRNGVLIATSPSASYSDSNNVLPETVYSYRVDAFDASTNRSEQSAVVSVATPPEGGGGGGGGGGGTPQGGTFVPTDDSYVGADTPSTNYGTRTTLRFDGSPVIRTFLKFNVAGVVGTVQKATLRIYANSASSSGFAVHTSADTTWSESTIIDTNAPPISAAFAQSGGFPAGGYVEVDVTSVIGGDGSYTLALTGIGTTAVSLGSSESATPPQLVIQVAP